MNVLALDLSLTATGVAHCDGSTDTWSVKAKGPERLRLLRERLTSLLDAAIDVVVLEGYAFGRINQAAHLGELGGVIRLALWEAGVPSVDVPPASLKKYATGRGNASKEEVLVAAVKRLGYDGSSNDEADAMWLRAMALDAYTGSALVPAAQRTALAKVEWPKIGVAP